jgi:septal ring factor EnvC (AmiA/AmiB activator)
MGKALKKDVARIGTVGQSDEPVQEDESALAKKAKQNAQEVSRLRKDLALKDETINALKAQIIELENAKAQLEQLSDEQRNSFDFMVSTGRRFTL